MFFLKKIKTKISVKFFIKNAFTKRIKKKLIMGFGKKSGRNFFGRITVFTKGGGLRKKLRIIDWKRILQSGGIIVSKEKVLDRTGYLGCICFDVGLVAYVLLPNNKEFLTRWEGFNFTNPASVNFLFNYPLGSEIHNIELKPNEGGLFTRSAGTSSLLVSKTKNKVNIKLASGVLKQVSGYSVASSGKVSNRIHKYLKLKNAGMSRRLGIKPNVRGVAMNPVDHPHGGGEGKKSNPRNPSNPWGRRLKWKKLNK